MSYPRRFPFGQQYVETAFGQTFILTAGCESNPPVILLHGSCSNSAFWFPEIIALSNAYRVYAADIIGEAGNSEEYRPDIDSDAFALWMNDVLNALNIESSVLIGNSLNYETRIHSIVINKKAVIEDFFVLNTNMAGEILQKFITYKFKLAIVGDFSGYTSKSLKDFIYESNKIIDIFFVFSEEDAIERLSRA